MANSATQFIDRPNQPPYRPGITTAADPYNDFIWALAKKFTDSAEEAEAAALEMQYDMERCAKERTHQPSAEEKIVARIAWRRLMKFLE